MPREPEDAGRRFLAATAAEVTPASQARPHRFEAGEIAGAATSDCSAAAQPKRTIAAGRRQ
jgi:hypothetical protein